MKHIFIIEHLEPEVFPWCLIEYKHISEIVGKENLWFTNLAGKKGASGLKEYGRCLMDSVRTLKLENVCVLDPDASQTLVPQDSSEHQYFVFGGILGDDPPRARTKEELTPFLPDAEVRNIGKEQLSTDNAVFVVHEILAGTPLEKMKFQDGIEIEINDVESVQLPYRYPLIDGKPKISPELIKYVKKSGF